MSSLFHHLRLATRPGIDAVKLLWLPFALIQLTGLIFVVMYFRVPAVSAFCDDIGALKARMGLWFAMITMPIACAIMPEAFKFLTGVDRSIGRERFGLILHNLVLFLVSGIQVDLVYTGLGNWLGDTRAPQVVVTKVLIDQLGYTPFIAIPEIAFAFTLRRERYRIGAALRRLNARWVLKEVVPVLLTCWAYWVPMLCFLYTLPPKVTFVYALVASAASATLLTAVAGRKESKLGDLRA